MKFRDRAALFSYRLQSRHAVSAWLILVFIFLSVPLAARELPVLCEKDVPVPMRDGTILRANICWPSEGWPYLVLVYRTSYGKMKGGKLERYARAGYIVVTQDARGRHASDGQFESFVRFETRDAVDGYDTVEWAAKLPGSTGKVGTFGASYDSFLQWRLASLRPPSLVAMSASSVPARYTDLEGPWKLRPGRRLAWWYYTISPNLHRKAGTDAPHLSGDPKTSWKNGEGERLLNLFPRMDLPDWLFGSEADAVKFWMKNAQLDPWQLDKGCRDIAVPNLDIIGWYDHCNGSIDMHQATRKHGFTKVARENQRLIIGPWSHSGRGARKVGKFDFGPDAALDTAQEEIRWFDYWLKGEDNGVADESPVRIFIMGANRWRNEPEWPPRRAESQTLYLSSGGHANTPSGDGALGNTRPKRAGLDRFVYDPRDPVPTLWTEAMFTVPADQRPHAKRQDILVYQTEPLAEVVEVTGYPEVVLHAASSAPDTDFFARLIDVAPDGSSRDVASGMVRARYRKGLDKSRLLEPGTAAKFVIRMGPTANEFQPGHRIRLDITSSDFPNYDVNHNTAADQNVDATRVTALQTIHHGGWLSSRLILPVIGK